MIITSLVRIDEAFLFPKLQSIDNSIKGVPLDFQAHKSAKRIIWSDADLGISIDDNLFDPNWVLENTDILGQGLGRGAALIFNHQSHDMVLRHYRRGGMIGRILKDRYFGRTPNKTRAFQELSLLSIMHQKGLPVPRPIAARMIHHGLFYRADILLEKIPNSQTLEDAMRNNSLSASGWAELGTVISQFHAEGIDHTDLNIRNIMLDKDQKFWLIDFDKCSKRPPGSWAANNMARLHRSFEKENAKYLLKDWNAENWALLCKAYQN